MSGYCVKELDVIVNGQNGSFAVDKALSLDKSSSFPNCSFQYVIIDSPTYTQLTNLDYGSLGITSSTVMTAFSFGFASIFSIWAVGYVFRIAVDIIRGA